MCEFSGNLVAWMDGELARHEAVIVAQHVEACEECRERVALYEEASRGFAAHYDATLERAEAAKKETNRTRKTGRKFPVWVPVVTAVGATAAVLLLILLPRSSTPIPVVPLVAVTHPPVAEKPAIKPLTPVRRVHVPVRHKAPAANWAMSESAIQIAIPADSMFPPGAVPEGIHYVASLSLADGSVQAIRLQP